MEFMKGDRYEFRRMAILRGNTGAVGSSWPAAEHAAHAPGLPAAGADDGPWLIGSGVRVAVMLNDFLVKLREV